MKAGNLVAVVMICVIGVAIGLLARRGSETGAAPAPPAARRARPTTAPRLPGRSPVAMPAAPRGIADDVEYQPRDPEEWQGMLVNVTFQAECAHSDQCGLAMACVDDRCGPCASDDQCGGGEACVLDHCVKAEQVSCRSRRDCAGAESLCILSGYSSDPRSNADMTATCQSASGGRDQDFEAYVPPETVPAPPIAILPSALLDSLPTED